MCDCIPASNITCGSDNEIGLAQPTCQELPDGTTNTNPYFDSPNNISYWTYKILNLCNIFGREIFIPIYSGIPIESITVDELILTCGRFEQIPFDIENPPGVTPPEDFQYLHISLGTRFTQANTGVYRLAIVGNYPATPQALYVIDVLGEVLEFNFDYLVPSEPQFPRLAVTKQGVVNANGNQGSIDYTVTVSNNGNTDLTDVMINDTTSYDGLSITIGAITTTPPLDVDVSMPGTIRITGNLGDIAEGESVVITYTVPIENVADPNSYSFNSATSAMNTDTQASIDTTVLVEAVQLGISLMCDINTAFDGTFDLLLTNIANSPRFNISLMSTILIPTDITVQFVSFAACVATYATTGEPVPLNTDITGRAINIQCDAVLPPSITNRELIELRVISSSADSTGSNIPLTIQNAILTTPDVDQIFLGTVPNLPIIRNINVSVDTDCENPCVLT